MSAFRLAPMEIEPPPRARRPRIKDERALAFIRSLPCVICGAYPADPAHLRAGNRLLGMRPVGVAEKPDDRGRVSPLCRKHHDEQHAGNELAFWSSYGIENPWQLCLALFAASHAEDIELAEAILAQHRMLGRTM